VAPRVRIIYATDDARAREIAEALKDLAKRYGVEAILIGNGNEGDSVRVVSFWGEGKGFFGGAEIIKKVAMKARRH